jgi:hypothetical protein
MNDSINLAENQLVPVGEPTATSTMVTIEMVVGSVEKNDEGHVKVNYFAKFTTGNGHHILYPWEGLKQTVLQWIEIEKQQIQVVAADQQG